jgi:hypothetical protein
LGASYTVILTYDFYAYCSQAGGSTVATVFHKLTKQEHRLPSVVNHSAYWAFWGVNTLLSIVPQIVAIRLMWLPVHVGHQVKNGKQKSNSKAQVKQKRNSRKLKEN